jgi:hypothetical protein
MRAAKKPVERLDIHRFAALATSKEVSEAVEFGVRQRLVLGEGSHYVSNVLGDGLRYHPCLPIASQTAEQPRISLLRTVIAENGGIPQIAGA